MKRKKLAVLICAVALAATSITGCGVGSGGDSKAAKDIPKSADDVDLSKHVDISIGGLSLGDSGKDAWPTEVIKAVEDKFNCSITTKAYDTESLNLDLTGGNTTDIVQISDENIAGVLKGGHAVNLIDYKNIAPNIFAEPMEFRNNIMQKFKSEGEEGAQYFVTPRVSFENQKENYGARLQYGYVVRWDLYKAIGCPEINNDDDYINACLKMKEIYPKTENGDETYAMSAYNDSGLHSYFFKGCLAEGFINLEGGLYVQDVTTNDLVADVYDEGYDGTTPFWSGVEFYNKLYKAGLLDPDNFITKSEDLTEKYTKGQYLGGTTNWFYSNYNTNNAGTDKEYIVLPSKLGWCNEPNRAGYSGKYFFVSSHSKNVDRAVMVLDYLQSGEFSRMSDSGVEGRWEKGDDGMPHLTKDTIAMKTDSSRSDEWKESGIGDTNTGNFTGWSPDNVLDDGGCVSLWQEESVMKDSLTAAEKGLCEQFGINLPSDLLKQRIESGKSIDQRDSDGTIRMCLETTPKDVVRIDSNCTEIVTKALPSLVQAKTDKEFTDAKEALMQQLKDANVETSVKWWQEAWKTSKAAVEKLETE